MNNFATQRPPVIRLISLLLLFQTIAADFALAQNNDSLPGTVDSAKERRDSFKVRTAPKKVLRAPLDTVSANKESSTVDSASARIMRDTSWMRIAGNFADSNFIRFGFLQNKLFAFSSPPVAITSNKKEFEGKEIFFYGLIGLLLFFAFIKFSFPKYFMDLFRVAFRTTIKQRQLSEQLLQTPIPSLLLNFFFLLSAGLYADFALEHYHLTNNYNFWLLYLYCFLGLGVIYIVKFLTLKFCGWLFNISQVTDSYIFIVFMINKIIGIYLLPFLVLLAFADNNVYQVAFGLSYIGVFALVAYRFILSYGLIQNQIRLNLFHFFLYLCAFEIVPLFLIYKALLLWF